MMRKSVPYFLSHGYSSPAEKEWPVVPDSTGVPPKQDGPMGCLHRPGGHASGE